MSDSKLLILSSPDDMHYQVVHYGLRSAGIRVDLVSFNNFPQHDTHTLCINNDRENYVIVRHDGQRIVFSDYDVVWNRRAVAPVVSPNLSSADILVAEREATMFVEGAKIACASEQMWINDPMVERIVGLKPFQLHMARRCGLNIPQTIMTNGSRQLKDFVKVNKSSIIKTFYPVTWCNGDRFIMAYASRVTNLELVDLSAVALTSNLAQSYIEKEFELRIFYFDGEITSVRIHSQGSEKSEVDWRAQFDGTLEVEIYRDLPRDISTRIREFSSEVGLKYGAFDFIAGQDGKFYFLECNPSGQFLFLEDWNPSIRLTASFLKLLTNNMALSSKQRDKLDGFSLKDMMQDSDANIYYKNQTASWPVSIPASFNYEEVSSI